MRRRPQRASRSEATHAGRITEMTQREAPNGPLPSHRSFGADRFAALWSRCVTSPPSSDAATVYADLARELGAPDRHFHTLAHIRDCLQRLDEVAPLLGRRDEVELGLWFHDAIYVPGDPNNERRSAELFLGFAAGAAPGFRQRVCRLILATRHLAPVQYDDRAFIVDIDLAGLGEPWDAFMHKGDLLRREFAGVSDDAYYGAQVVFLQRLVERRSLFATAYFRAAHESAARSNLQRLLALRATQGYATS